MSNTTEFKRRRTLGRAGAWLLGGLFAVSSLLTGCGSSGDETDSSSDSGDVYIGLTDAPGDFSSYSVDVTSLTLTHRNGAVVEALPVETRVDFAQYVEMTELLTAATLPKGVYVKGELTIDYSSADIRVEDEAGDIVQVTDLRDEAGDPVTTLTISVELEDHDSLLIAPGIPASLTLDFDLNASHSTDFSGAAPVTTISPVLLAEVDAERPKVTRVRGPLQSVDLDASSYQVVLRPLHHSVRRNSDRRFGAMTVQTDDDTAFEIDGVIYSGADGLNALAAMPTLSATVALGELNLVERRFEATEVYAGSSVPGGDQDVIRGHVVARSGNVITVKGATLIRSGGSAVFGDTVAVTVGDATQVTRQGSEEAFTIAAISVGQKLTVFGTLTDQTAGSLALDATAGLARLQLTSLRGTVAANDGSELAMDLQRLDRRPVGEFDFTGTGTSADNDADPANYQLDTASLDISGFALSEPMMAKGFAAEFGSAPADFEARTLVDLSEVKAVMSVNWDPANAGAFSAVAAEGLTVNLDGVGRFHHISQLGVHIDLSGSDPAPQVVPDDSGLGLYVIKQGDVRQLHTDFANFASDLQSRLDGGAAVARLVASGSWDGEVLSARRVSLKLD